jgi:2-polyprenyl-3-methyl-5-hydroxy-6-metoxy-1,4-benzoquinol methylase
VTDEHAPGHGSDHGHDAGHAPHAPDHSHGATFDYSEIPPGYYDQVMRDGPSIQRAWHRQKFARVREALELPAGGRVLDVGCGPGSFLGSYDLRAPDAPAELVGMDIASDQIAYANEHYGAGAQRRYLTVGAEDDWPFAPGTFDAVTVIEVVEHLYADQIRSIFDRAANVLKPNGVIVITTPNYASHWPILEKIIARRSAVSYHEQHISHFNRFTVKRRLSKIAGDRFRWDGATTMHFVAPFLAPLSKRFSDGVASRVTPRHWAWPFGALIIARLRLRG